MGPLSSPYPSLQFEDTPQGATLPTNVQGRDDANTCLPSATARRVNSDSNPSRFDICDRHDELEGSVTQAFNSCSLSRSILPIHILPHCIPKPNDQRCWLLLVATGGDCETIFISVLLVLLAMHIGAQAKSANPQAKSSFVPTDPATSASALPVALHDWCPPRSPQWKSVSDAHKAIASRLRLYVQEMERSRCGGCPCRNSKDQRRKV
jgi:hypothetical protein